MKKIILLIVLILLLQTNPVFAESEEEIMETTKEKFDILTENDEYLFDEDKETKNAEEFYREFKIKPHFQKKLEPQISFNPIKKKGKKSADERIIDF